MIEYFKKNYLLPRAINRSIRRRQPIARSIHYADAEDVLILLTLEGNESIYPVRHLQKQLEKDGKSVSFVSLLLEEAGTPDVHLDKDMLRLVKEEIGLAGKVLNAEVSRQLRRKFDYLVHADLTTNPWASLLVATSRANYRIGRHFNGCENLYDIMIDIGNKNDRDHLVSQLYHYLKAL